jgi:hypothetical protein
MQIIRTTAHEKYNCEKIIEVWGQDWCNRTKWTAEDNYHPNEGEHVYVVEDNVVAYSGLRLRDGQPIPHDVLVLEDIKIDKLEEISAAYLGFDTNGTTVTGAGYPIQVGQAHVTKLDGAIRFAEMIRAEVIYITDANDATHHDVTLDQAKQVLTEQMGAALAAHAKKQELRARVAAAETIEEVRAISW